MSLITPAQLVELYGCPYVRAANFAPYLNDAMWAEGIVTPIRIRAFLAQIGHESGRLRYTREIWGDTPAQRRYEGRADLGNTEPGDGRRYMGRGLIQITGRANYQRVTDALGEDFVSYPALLETPKWAALSAGWYWGAHDLNALADAGDMRTLTRRINGGWNGLDDRMALYQTAQEVVA